MKHGIFAAISLIAASVVVSAAPVVEPTSASGSTNLQVIAKQGQATVDVLDVDAHVAPMAPADRSAFIDSPKRIEQMLAHILLRRNLAMEARELKLDKDPVVQRQMEQAIEGVLMGKRLDQLAATLVIPDMEALARERFLADSDRFKIPELVTVRHVLLNTNSRSPTEAIAQLEAWSEEIRAGKRTIEDLAKEHSEDPGVGSYGGLYENFSLDKFVPEFSAAIKALKVGELSPVVLTKFGYHLIQLESRSAERVPSFDDVKGQLIAQAKEKFIADAQRAHIEKLKVLPVEASEESIAPLRIRYGKLVPPSADSAQESTGQTADSESK